MAGNDNLSPNAIPPRISSTGISNFNSTINPSKPVLRPVAEGDWISPHKRMTSDAGLRPRNSTLAWEGNLGWSHVKENIVLGPYEYVADQPGKDIRRQLIGAFNAWLKVPESRLEVITKVITMLHNASLLVDDVEDNSSLRRGSPVAHSVFGVAQTINSGNYVYFLALHELIKLDNPALIQIYSDELCNLHRGQGMDLYWRDTLTCPSEEDYLEMVSNKTGGLFRLTIKLMQAEATVQKDCLPLVNTIGLIFQIRDDYMNLFGTDYTKNKGLCEDLTEGNLQLVNILKQKTTDSAVKKYAVGVMEKTGSFIYCRKVVKELLERAETMVLALDDGAGESGGVQAILQKFALEDV